MPTVQQSAIVAAALEWLRTPYHHRARLKGIAVDCAMLLYAVFVDELQLVPPFDYGDYPPDWMMHRSEERFLAHVETYTHEVDDPQPGDVVLYRVGRCFAHAAIVVDWPQVIHADIHFGAVALADATQGRLAGRERCVRRLNALGVQA